MTATTAPVALEDPLERLRGARQLTIALDFDGTVVDTMPALTALAVEVLTEELGLEAGEACRRYLATVGAPIGEQLAEIAPGRYTGAALARFEVARLQLTLDTPPFGDVDPALRRWRGAGHRVVLVSSTNRAVVRDWVSEHRIFLEHEVLGYVAGRVNATKAVQLRRRAADVLLGDAARDEKYAVEAGCAFLGVARPGHLLAPVQPRVASLEDVPW